MHKNAAIATNQIISYILKPALRIVKQESGYYENLGIMRRLKKPLILWIYIIQPRPASFKKLAFRNKCYRFGFPNMTYCNLLFTFSSINLSFFQFCAIFPLVSAKIYWAFFFFFTSWLGWDRGVPTVCHGSQGLMNIVDPYEKQEIKGKSIGQ